MRWSKTLVTLSCLLVSASSAADPGDHPVSMWRVDSPTNQIYLLGSIHLLREQDYPISPAIYAAYEDSETLYMELDMDDSDPVADQILVNELGLIGDGRSLRDLLGESDYAEAERLALAAQIPLQLLDKAEPWYAAIQVELIMLLRIGFNPQFGIESHFAQKSAADGKEIYGLESTREQLGFLDNLSAAAQREMFMQTLADSTELSETMNTLIDAWHAGDSTYLRENLLSDMQEYPELNRIIVDDRNFAWTEKMEELLTQDQNYFVIVGALHLVGENGVPRQLARRGYEVTQLHQSAE